MVLEAEAMTEEGMGAGKKGDIPLTPSRLMIIGLAGAFAVLLVGCLVWPQLFWDGFVFRYIWSSTEADAQGHPVNGLTEDYNIVSTAFYGIILAAAVYIIYDGFKKRMIEIGTGYILALVPFVLFGTLTRSLEDSYYFSVPTAYIFIAPQIYALVGALVVGLTVLGKSHPRRVWPFLWLLVPVYLLFFVGGFGGNPISEPPILASLVLIIFTALLTFVELRRGHSPQDLPAFLWPFGLQSIAAPLFLAAYWCANPGSWGPIAARDIELHLPELLVIPAITLAATFLLWLLFESIATKFRRLAPLASGIGTMVFFGHMLDASATFAAINWFGYGEKHVLASSLINATGTALVMFPMKAIAIGLTLYILLVELKEELGKDKMLQGLLMAAIFILGLSPGLRDLFRLAMGV